jgi:outer membrane lipoprotein SlyB
MKNEVVDSIWVDIKQNPIGKVGGAIAGYLISKKLPIPFITIPAIIVGAIMGSVIESKLTTKTK